MKRKRRTNFQSVKCCFLDFRNDRSQNKNFQTSSRLIFSVRWTFFRSSKKSRRSKKAFSKSVMKIEEQKDLEKVWYEGQVERREHTLKDPERRKEKEKRVLFNQARTKLCCLSQK